MANVRNLIETFAEQEARLLQTTFLAPCVPGGSVCTRVEGMVYTFAATPPDFEGWGLFRPVDAKQAQLVEEASLSQVATYLKLFPTFQLHLILPLQHQTWLAYPANTSDVRQRVGDVRPIPVHLVMHGAAFEAIRVRWDGGAWWYEAEDRRTDPRIAAYLREALKAETEPGALQNKGLTPEMRSAYSLAFRRTETARLQRRCVHDKVRLQQALDFAGGALQDFHDRGDFWLVDWNTPDGESHRSAINKQDLTVVSAGICLSDQDQDFDLQSLVSVVAQRPDWMH